MQPPQLEFAFEARVSIAPRIEAGLVQGGRRRIIPITGGTVTGPRLNGKVVPGGADWQIVSAAGVTDLTARYTIQAEDGALIGVVNRGLRHTTTEVQARLDAGENVDPALVYFRTTPVFEAPEGPHHWLTRHIFLGSAERHAAGVLLRFFTVL